jgi:hypothetical protein
MCNSLSPSFCEKPKKRKRKASYILLRSRCNEINNFKIRILRKTKERYILIYIHIFLFFSVFFQSHYYAQDDLKLKILLTHPQVLGLQTYATTPDSMSIYIPNRNN